jgi:glucosamine--fructose-6-phosphate aminotransferase (isomerizing)
MALKWLGDILCQRDVKRSRRELKHAAPAVAAYLADWKEYVLRLTRELDDIRHLFLVGRGASLAAVGTGALIVKESDHFHAEGMSSASFRHGPFEMLSEETFVLVFLVTRRLAILICACSPILSSKGGELNSLGRKRRSNVFG